MKHYRTLILFLSACIILSSCKEKFDKEGRLFVQHLTSDGTLEFKPMMRSDSASVKEFAPKKFYYDGTPFTGPMVFYDSHDRLSFTGYLKNGLADSSWRFYFATGGVRMEGWYRNGIDVGLWRSYYGYGKPNTEKYYDDYGYMLMRVEYFDNGRVKNYQNVKCPLFDNKERSYSFDRHGDTLTMYMEDSVLMLKKGELTDRIGENLFVKKGASKMEVVK